MASSATTAAARGLTKRGLVFYYDIVCPFAYLAANRVSRIQATTGLAIEWKPVLLGGVYGATAAPQGKDGSATDVMNSAKRLVTAADLRQQADRLGVPLRWNSRHPVRTVDALRLVLSAPAHERPELSMALYKAYWQDDRDVANVETLAQIAKGFSVSVDAVADPKYKQALRDTTDEAVKRGAFGVPSLYSLTAERIFWGEDRLHFAMQAEGFPREQCEQPRLALPTAAAKPRKLTYYHDFSSPFSYLASTQVERVAKECGAQLEYVPILLGALFRTIGAPNAPMMVMSDSKRAYVAKEFADWAAWWSIPFQFPADFPLRTVLPLRVCIVEPRTTPVIYSAAWGEGKNVGDPETLVGILNDAGFDGLALCQATQEQAVKDQLKANTERALEVGACGVPTFQVDGGDLVWGQDRLHVVADMLCGWQPSYATAAATDETITSKL